MSLFLGIITFILVLSALILVHELGHFSMAKLFGVRVEEFGLGFPPRLKTWWRNGTLYSLNALPLGGFVKMAGENGDLDDPASFGAKPPWQRFVILVAGPSMNLILSLLIFFCTFSVGFPVALTTITQVAPDSPAARSGLQRGDTIVAVNGRHVRYRSDLQAVIDHDLQVHPGKAVSLRVVRGRSIGTVWLVPRVHPPVGQGPIGIALGRNETLKYGPLVAARKSVESVGSYISTLPEVISSISQHGTRDLAGPIGIAHLTTQAVGDAPQDGPSPLLALVALLSANLGILNLLPIPALDGGRLVFVLISWVRRRNLDPEVEGIIHLVGMAVLLLLIAFISYQDLSRWISGSS